MLKDLLKQNKKKLFVLREALTAQLSNGYDGLRDGCESKLWRTRYEKEAGKGEIISYSYHLLQGVH